MKIVVIIAMAVTIGFSMAHVFNIVIPVTVQEKYHLYKEEGGKLYFPPLK